MGHNSDMVERLQSLPYSEKVQVFATHMKEALSQKRLQFLHMVYESDVEHHLHDHLYYGMVKTLWDSIHNLYDAQV